MNMPESPPSPRMQPEISVLSDGISDSAFVEGEAVYHLKPERHGTTREPVHVHIERCFVCPNIEASG